MRNETIEGIDDGTTYVSELTITDIDEEEHLEEEKEMLIMR